MAAAATKGSGRAALDREEFENETRERHHRHFAWSAARAWPACHFRVANVLDCPNKVLSLSPLPLRPLPLLPPLPLRVLGLNPISKKTSSRSVLYKPRPPAPAPALTIALLVAHGVRSFGSSPLAAHKSHVVRLNDISLRMPRSRRGSDVQRKKEIICCFSWLRVRNVSGITTFEEIRLSLGGERIE